MTLDEFRSEMWAYLEDAKKRSVELKDSGFVERRLQRLYRRFNSEERAMAEVVLSEWLRSTDKSARFAARLIIYDFKISTMQPALEQKVLELKRSKDVSAPFEIRAMESLIGFLGGRRQNRDDAH